MKTKQHKNTSFIILGFIFLFGIILFASNPTKSKFKEYIKEDLKEKAYQEDKYSGAMMEILAAPVSWMTGAFTERKDFLFFSTYEITLSNNDRTIYIGVLNTFIKIK